MSAPRSAWLTDPEIVHRRERCKAPDDRLYHLIPADPDGPMPGETWMCDGGVPAEVVRPRSLRSDGEVESWWVKCGEIFAVSSQLTRIPEPPEHKPWCPADKIVCCHDHKCVGPGKHPCTCERRKGERRKKDDASPYTLPNGEPLYDRGKRYTLYPDARLSDRRASDTEGGA